MGFALDLEDTIGAIASASSGALRGLVRISGPRAWEVALIGLEARAGECVEPGPGRVVSGHYRLTGLASVLPADVVFWKGPRSYTSQDLVEVSMIGSPPLLDYLLSHFLASGARLAEPGEFTLRAFLTGRIELTQAEAVLGVVDSNTPEQLDAALRQLAGGLAGPIERLRNRLLDVVAHLEAGLDFVDEEDVDPIEREALARELEGGARELEELSARFQERDRAGGLPRVVLAGPPNAGKSSLFNAIVGQERAIVSAQEGTTRDYLTAICRLEGGGSFELIDTAGSETDAGEISRQAQAKRGEQVARADLVLCCVAPGGVVEQERPMEARGLRVATMRDLGPPAGSGYLITSARTGLGIEELKRAIQKGLARLAAESNPLAHTSARCRESLSKASGCLSRAAQAIESQGGEELVAIDLRDALDALGQVVGAIVTDDILDRIFQRFCIGK